MKAYVQSVMSRRVLGLVLLGALWLSGCALTPKSEQAELQSQRLLSAQLDAVERHLLAQPAGRRTVVYVGSAQHAQSRAFQRDVLDFKHKLESVNPEVQSIILSNELSTQQLLYPFAHAPTLKQTFDRLADWSKRHSITLVWLVSTHGNVNLLSVNIANTYYPYLDAAYAQQLLAPIPHVPTVIILSACHSGSFIAPLRRPNRLIMTAAAADRSSFGCAFNDPNTYFIGQMLHKAWDPDRTWFELFQRTASEVAALETARKVGPPSNPQFAGDPRINRTTLRAFLSP